MSIRRFIERNGRLLGVAAIVVVLSAVGVTLFLGAHVRVLHQAFRDRSLAYVQAFASASLPWMYGDDLTMLRAAAQLLLAGSAQYVQIVDGTRLLIDERTAFASDIDLAALPAVASSSVTLSQGVSGESLLDVLVPLPSLAAVEDASGDADGRGYVRVGIDRSAVLAQSSGVVAIAAGATIGFNVALIVLLALVLRSPKRGLPMADREARIITAGALEIDVGRKAVRLDGRPVRLTPKQFTLVELLAGQPGRVFSESEILEAAWPDSPYADAKDVKQYIYLVRGRLAAVDPDARGLIETVPGFGYRLATGDVDRELT